MARSKKSGACIWGQGGALETGRDRGSRSGLASDVFVIRVGVGYTIHMCHRHPQNSGPKKYGGPARQKNVLNTERQHLELQYL